MNIAETREKCKAFLAKIPRDVLIIAVLILASSASFGLGYLAGVDASAGLPGQGQGGEIKLEELPATASSQGEGKFVASKNGTKYYLPSCAGADKISDANKVWFASVATANAAGYTPAANCKGL